jgi:hypothetical protein
MSKVKGKQLSFPKSKPKTFLARLPPGMWERVSAAIQAEVRMAPQFSPVPSVNSIVVKALAAHVAMWESIEASPEAQHAGRVLKGARSRG